MSTFKHLHPNDLVAMMDDTSVQVVDIRDPMAFSEGHIPGAKHLDNTTVQPFMAQAEKAAPLVVCCYHGNSSQSAAAFLSEQGFADVYSLDGGFSGWQMQYPDRVERN